VSFRVRDR